MAKRDRSPREEQEKAEERKIREAEREPERKAKTAFLKDLGARIRRLRVEKGLSRDRVALDSDLNRASLLRIEDADVEPGIWTLAKIASVIDVPLADLVDLKKMYGWYPASLRRRGR